MFCMNSLLERLYILYEQTSENHQNFIVTFRIEDTIFLKWSKMLVSRQIF